MVYHHLTFERGGGGGAGGGYGWFEEKISCRLIWRESNMLQGNFLETNILHWKKLSLLAYDAGKKSYTVICRGKKILGKKNYPNQITHISLPQPLPPPQKSIVRPLRDVIGENRFHNCAHESEKR